CRGAGPGAGGADAPRFLLPPAPGSLPLAPGRPLPLRQVSPRHLRQRPGPDVSDARRVKAAAPPARVRLLRRPGVAWQRQAPPSALELLEGRSRWAVPRLGGEAELPASPARAAAPVPQLMLSSLGYRPARSSCHSQSDFGF